MQKESLGLVPSLMPKYIAIQNNTTSRTNEFVKTPNLLKKSTSVGHISSLSNVRVGYIYRTAIVAYISRCDISKLDIGGAKFKLKRLTSQLAARKRTKTRCA